MCAQFVAYATDFVGFEIEGVDGLVVGLVLVANFGGRLGEFLRRSGSSHFFLQVLDGAVVHARLGNGLVEQNDVGFDVVAASA